jgi:hypothetical protein
MIETFLTLLRELPALRERPVLHREQEQARERGPEPPSQRVSALRLSCTLQLLRIKPRQKTKKQ